VRPTPSTEGYYEYRGLYLSAGTPHLNSGVFLCLCAVKERRRYHPEKKPYLGGMITDEWYRGLGETIWTPYIIRYVYARGYFNLYTNFDKKKALSVSYRDAGSNYKVPTHTRVCVRV
jgi:hypothetical protein